MLLTKTQIKNIIQNNHKTMLPEAECSAWVEALYEMLREFEIEDRNKFVHLATKDDIKPLATKEELKLMIEMFNARFEDMHKYTNKRFEAVDKRFEDMHKYMDKRFTFTQWLIFVLFTTYTTLIGLLVKGII